MDLALAVSAALLIGFLAGLIGLRIRRRWCPVCGSTLTCPDLRFHLGAGGRP